MPKSKSARPKRAKPKVKAEFRDGKPSSSIFKNLTFVVSKTEDKLLEEVITNHGGKVQKPLTKNTNYFVQGYNTEDDDRLGEAGDKDIRVISPEYIHACVEAGQLLDINTQAMGEPDDKEGFPGCMFTSVIAKCFKPPSTECREREELPQSFGEFLKTEKQALGTFECRIIYLVPLIQKSRKRYLSGQLKAKDTHDVLNEDILDEIAEFLSNYFSMPTSVLPALTLKIGKTDAILEAGKYNYSIAVHRKGNQSVRLDAMEIIGALEEIRPEDGYCILGLTPEDIYEDDPHDNSPLLGRSTGDRAGILSTSYYSKLLTDPKYTQKAASGPSTSVNSVRFLRTLFNISAHETMHMFGIDHCAYYSCIMNSWSDPLADPEEHPEKVAPLHLCPIDLRKIHNFCDFYYIKARYESLLNFYAARGIVEEVKWIRDILKILGKETS